MGLISDLDMPLVDFRDADKNLSESTPRRIRFMIGRSISMKRKVIFAIFIVILTLYGCKQNKKISVSDKLYLSIENGNYQGVKEALKEKDLDLENIGEKERTNFMNNDRRALSKAIESSSENRNDIILLLLEAGAEVNSDSKYETYLQYAVGEGDVKLAMMLVRYGANVNAKAGGCRVLDAAVQSLAYESGESQVKLIKDLISKGAKVDKTTVKYALRGKWKYSTVKELLKTLKKNRIEPGIGRVLQAAVNGDDKDLQRIIKTQEVKQSEKAEIVFFAASNCDVNTLKTLKKQGYRLDEKDVDSMTPLHIASRYNDAEVVRYLISQKVNGESKFGDGSDDIENYSSLDYALISGDIKKYQLCKKANIKTSKTQSHWDAVIKYGTQKSMQLYVKLFGKPSLSEIAEGWQSGNQDAIKYLTKHKYIAATINGDMAREATMDNIRQLYSLGALATQEALNYFVEEQDNKFIKEIIQKKQYQGELDQEVLLYHAVNSGNLELTKYFITQGADVNKLVSEDDVSKTALHVATDNTSIEILKYLLNHGADKKIKDGDGNTAYDIAKATKDEEFMKLLR